MDTTKDNLTKTIYSFSKYLFELGRPVKEWTVEKETEKTYTVTFREGDFSTTVTVRKALMEHWGDVFTLSREEAEEQQRNFVAYLIVREQERISAAKKNLEEYSKVYKKLGGVIEV